MTSPPDKLFRQGLEHYQKPAPGSAWDRIESGLDKKKHKSPWFKIAATLLLLMVASFVIWQLNEADTAVATISKESSSGKLTTDTISLVATEESKYKIRESSDVRREASGVRREAVGNREASIVSREVINGRKSSRLQPPVLSSQSAVAIQTSVAPDESHMIGAPEPNKTSIELTSPSQVEITNEISTTEVASDSKRTSITYTADEVNEKFLKKESTPQATPEKKNTSGLQKVIDLALDLKNEGSVLGDIREKKNEWLSFNIPSNKRETNK